MTKVSKRIRATHKRRQELSKRNWQLYNSRKTYQRRFATTNKECNFKSNINTIVVPKREFCLLTNLRARCEDILTHTKSFGQSVAESFGYTVNVLKSFASVCISLSCNKLNRAVLVVNERKDIVHSGISAFMYNGYVQFKKAVDFVGDVIFPSRPYKRKLDEMCDRLEEVENELKKMKRDAMLSEQRVPSQMHGGTISMSVTNTSPPTCPLPAAPPPAPPPPPPPPPPVCKPPQPISFKKTKKGEEELKKATPKIGVTLKDLASVRLRKVVLEQRNDDKENDFSPLSFALRRRTRPGSPFKQLSTAHPFISLRDIKKVTLRKTATNTTRKSRSPGLSKIAFLKTNLRKVHVQRSPGGTPCAKKSKQCHGEGLTPIITRALQRKFKFANPVSPNNLSFDDTISLFETSRRSSPSGTKPKSPLIRSPRSLTTKSPLARSSLPSSPLTRLR